MPEQHIQQVLDGREERLTADFPSSHGPVQDRLESISAAGAQGGTQVL